jgi:lipopolysaccharide biosynthesis regulator YciM
MSNLKRPQIVAIAVAILAVVLLLLLPRTAELKSESEEISRDDQMIDYVDLAMNELNENDKIIYGEIRSRIEATEDPMQKINWLDSMSHFWESRNQLLLSADYLHDVAEIIADKPSYFIAGDKYFEAFNALKDEQKVIALNKAISSYEAILVLNPEDMEAMTSLGVCYVEGAATLGEAPMKGIGILRQVLEKDPENINALINLGYFAAKSGQFEKAIERFNRVIEIDPEFTDAYLYLSDAYMQMGNKEEGIRYLEKFKEFIQDPEKREQLEIYIENIRNNSI